MALPMYGPPGLCRADRPSQWHRGATGRRPDRPPLSISTRSARARARSRAPTRGPRMRAPLAWRLERTTARACVRVAPACSLCRRRAARRVGRPHRPPRPAGPTLCAAHCEPALPAGRSMLKLAQRARSDRSIAAAKTNLTHPPAPALLWPMHAGRRHLHLETGGG